MRKRLLSLDVLRGIFLSMAMWQYYSYFSDYWYVEFSPHVGATPFPITPGGRLASVLFTPWVSQVYIFLACVNLNLSFRTPLMKRQRKWLLYAGLMILESFFVWPKWADALTPPAVVLGIATMLIVSGIGRLWGWKGVAAALTLFCITYDRWLIPFGDMLEFVVQNSTSIPEWEYNARLEYFLGTGCLGFLVGYWLRDLNLRKVEWLIALSVLMAIPYFFWGHSYYLPTFDVFENEYRLSRDLINLSGLWALILLTVSLSVYLELRNMSYGWARPLIWISVHTWTIFAVHRLIYIYGYGPILEKLASKNLSPAHPPFAVIVALSFITCGLVWLALKLISKVDGVNFIHTVRTKIQPQRRS